MLPPFLTPLSSLRPGEFFLTSLTNRMGTRLSADEVTEAQSYGALSRELTSQELKEGIVVAFSDSPEIAVLHGDVKVWLHESMRRAA